MGQGRAEARAEGEVAEKLAAVLAVLDLVTLDRWIARAGTAASVEDVLASDLR